MEKVTNEENVAILNEVMEFGQLENMYCLSFSSIGNCMR